MKKGLLLTAFLVTLVLDMGVGPVTIVFGAANLSKNSALPAASWLMVRGILNVVQFLTVIAMCWLVVRSKGKYSRKEESLFIARILTTHPLAYFYYLIILGGVVWNILGSCWIGSAFAFYSVGFSTCYLICVILSWISVAMSPLFVVFGGVSYSTLYPAAVVPEIQASVLIPETADAQASTSILQLLQDAKLDLSVDQLLTLDARNRRMQKEAISLSEGEMPITITELPKAEYEVQENPLLEDMQQPSRQGVTLIHRDVLDNEMPSRASAWGRTESRAESEQNPPCAVVVTSQEQQEQQEQQEKQENLVMMNMDAADVVIAIEAEANDKDEKTTPRSNNAQTCEMCQEDDEATQAGETVIETNKRTSKRGKRKKEKKENRGRNPKENIVIADAVIHDAQMRLPGELPLQSHADDSFVDVSSQMIHDLNYGHFDHNAANANVHVTVIE